MRAFENSAHERKIIMTIAEKREIVNTIINLLLQLTAEEEVQEQPATSSKPVKAPAQSVKMLTIKECTELIEGISEHSIRMLIAHGKIKAFRTGEGVRGKYLINKESLLTYFSENEEHFNTVWYDEDKPLGTGGGLNLLKGKLSGTFFLTNCDLLIFTDYEKLLRFHRESGSAVTMVCAEKHVTIPYGVVETGEGGVITAMQEKPAFQFLTNTGLYLVEPEVLDDIGEDEVIGFPDIIERQRCRGRRVSAYTVGEEDWLDMGQLDELEKMRERLYGKP